ARPGAGAVRDAPAGEPGRARRPLGVHGGGGRLAAAREAGRSGVRVVARVAAGPASGWLHGSARVRRPRGCAGRRGSGVRAVAGVAVAELVLPARPAGARGVPPDLGELAVARRLGPPLDLAAAVRAGGAVGEPARPLRAAEPGGDHRGRPARLRLGIARRAGLGGAFPGLGGTPSGLGGTPSGLGGAFPGLGGTSPGLGSTSPGLGAARSAGPAARSGGAARVAA